MDRGRQEVESQETKLVLFRFVTIGVLVPLCGIAVAALAFYVFSIETNGANIRFTVLLIWISSIVALSLALWWYMRRSPRARVSHTKVTRMDWELKGDRNWTAAMVRSALILPLCSSALLILWHQFDPIFTDADRIKLASIILGVATLAHCIFTAMRSRGRRVR